MDRDKAVSGGPLWIQTDELVRRKEGRGWFQGDQTPCEFKQEAEQGGEIFGSRFQGDQNPCGFKPRVAIATKLEPARGCRHDARFLFGEAVDPVVVTAQYCPLTAIIMPVRL